MPRSCKTVLLTAPSVNTARFRPAATGTTTVLTGIIIGITGDPAKVEAMYKSFRVYARKVDTDDGSYTMDHTASVFLLDADGGFVGTIAYQENPETAVAKLQRLIDG